MGSPADGMKPALTTEETAEHIIATVETVNAFLPLAGGRQSDIMVDASRTLRQLLGTQDGFRAFFTGQPDPPACNDGERTAAAAAAFEEARTLPLWVEMVRRADRCIHKPTGAPTPCVWREIEPWGPFGWRISTLCGRDFYTKHAEDFSFCGFCGHPLTVER